MKKTVLRICLMAVPILVLAALAAFVWPGFLSAGTGSGTAPSAVQTEPLSGPAGEMQVYFIDVGQGDSTLITDGEHTVLIDAGDRDHGNKVYSQLHSVSPDDHIDVLIITHDHIDHTGGLSKILKDCRADMIIAPAFDGENLAGLSALLEKQKEKGALLTVPGTNGSVDAGDIHLFLHRMAGDAKNENDASIITRVQYGDTVFLIMADAGTDAEMDYLKHSGLEDFDCDVLRTGHHGSGTSTERRFLEAVSPEYAVISVGQENTYGLPDQKTVSRLASAGCNLWITAQLGTVIAVSDGKTVSLHTVIPSASDLSSCPFIGNGKTLKLHDRNCSSVSKMADKNKVPFDSKEDALRQGYEPCGICMGGD